jgi:small subunit ribosomal protein S1
MPDPNTPEEQSPTDTAEATESFQDILSQYEKDHARKDTQASQGIEATVIKVTADAVLLDIGYKIEGMLPLTAFRAGENVNPGDKLMVTVKGRDPESGYYALARGKVARPTDWAQLEKAFHEKSTIVGTVTAAVKGGLSVDVGVRAFMPASRSGVRD